MFRVHDTSAAHSDVYKEFGMKTYGRELTIRDWKQEDEKKARRKSDILVDNCQEGIEKSQGMNGQGNCILVLVAGIPKFRYRQA